MTWIPAHATLARHPKLARLRRLLSLDAPTAIGHLMFLWWWCLDFAIDGDLTTHDPLDIAEACHWEGDPETFVDALVQAGFLDRECASLRVHDYADYGSSYKQKALTARRVARHRARADSLDSDSDVTQHRYTGVTETLHTVTDALPEEKRREEKRNDSVVPTSDVSRKGKTLNLPIRSTVASRNASVARDAAGGVEQRATRLTLEELPEEWRAWCVKTFPSLNPQAVFDEFHDYWVGLAGPKAVKLDWFATFRNSCRMYADRKPSRNGKGPPGGPSLQDLVARNLAEIRRMKAEGTWTGGD